MRYFLMKEDKRYTDRPIIVNWIDKVNLQQIYERNYDTVPRRMILEVKTNVNIEFVDIVSVPFLLVSHKVKKVLQLYEPNMQFKEIILLDKKNGNVGEYFLPLIHEKNALKIPTRENMSKLLGDKIQLDGNRLDDTAVFFVKGVPTEAGIWRSDIVETLLLRKAKGFLLECLEIV